MPTHLTHSFSSLKMFENCPKRYFHQRVEKSVKDTPHEATAYGERVHEALELYLKGDITELPPESKPHTRMVEKLTKLCEGREVLVEQELTLTKNLTPTGWWDADAWFRSKLDVLILQGNHAIDIDWKTGKRRPDFTQLGLFATQTFIHYPEIDKVTSAFVWLKEGVLDKQIYRRDHLPSLTQSLLSKTTRVEQALEKDVWPARPSGLCNWCPCKTFCEYAQRR